jgi:hypothetical protein
MVVLQVLGGELQRVEEINERVVIDRQLIQADS